MKNFSLSRHFIAFITCFALVMAGWSTITPNAYAGANPKGDPTPKPPEDCATEGAENGSIRYNLSFGKSAFDLLSGGMIKLHRAKPGPDLYSPDILYYKAPGAEFIWGDSIENGARKIRFLDNGGLYEDYLFASGASIGLPQGKNSQSAMRAYLLSAAGDVVANANNTDAVFVELRTGTGGIQRFSLAEQKVVGVGNAQGQYLDIASLPEAVRPEVINNEGAVLRQVKAAEGLADVVMLEEHGFEIRLYTRAQIGAKNSEGVYTVSGDPYRVVRFENPDPNSQNPLRMQIVDTWGDVVKEYMFFYQEALDDWMLNRGDGASKESKELISAPGENPKKYRRILRDGAGNTVSTIHFTQLTAPWGGAVITSETKDPDGLNYTTTYNYNTTSGALGYGKLESQETPDGSWMRYVYDAQGRVTKQISPWLDSPSGSAENASRVKEYQYSSDENDTRPIVEIERISGIEVSRTYYRYGNNTAGEYQEIVERAASQGAAYGATGNLRTTKTFYANGVGLASAGRLKTLEQADGRLTSYTYALNAASVDEFLVTTETEGTVSSPSGVSGKSLRRITTQDTRGLVTSEETKAFVTGGSFVTTQVMTHGYDAEGFRVQTRRNGDAIFGAVFSGGQRTSDTDETGITRLYTYDELGRLATETQRGVGAQPDRVTTYDRTLGGLDCGCDAEAEVIVSAGNLSLKTSVTKDQVGRITEQIDAAGMTTTYAYTDGGKVTTIVKPNTAMEVREVTLDGQTKSATGTGVVPQFVTRGVNGDGTRWQQVTLASPNGARWTKVTTDFLGRTIRTERPGFGGAVIAEENSYDAQSRLATSLQRVTGGDAPTSTGSEILQTATFTYDTLGNAIQTAVTRGTQTNITESDANFITNDGAVWSENFQAQDGVTVSRSRTRVTLAGDITAESWHMSLPQSNSATIIWNNTTATHTTVTADRVTATRVTTTKLPTSIQPSITTTVAGLTQSSISPSHGGETLYRYDALGRQTGQKEPRHTLYAEFTYNEKNQLTQVTDAAGNSTTYLYYENGTVGAGQLRLTTNALGGTVFKEYDLSGNEIYTWGSASYPVVQGYDLYGQRIMLRTFRDTVADFGGAIFPSSTNGDTTTWTYDDVTGALLQKTYADGKGPTYDYYADGQLRTRLWARTDTNGDRLATNYAYTAQGQLAAITYSDSTPNVTYEYNTLGQQTRVTDGTGTRTFTYDSENLKLIAENYLDGLHSGKTLYRSYDTYSRETGYALVGGVGSPSQPEGTTTDGESSSADETEKLLTAVTYTYDLHGRLTTVQGDEVPATLTLNAERSTLNATTFTYNRLPNSNLLATVTGPAHTVTNTYEENRDVLTIKSNQLNSGTTTITGDGVISRYAYTYDALARRATRTQSGNALDGIGYAVGTDLTPLAEKLTTTGGTLGTPGAGTSTDTFTYNTRSEVTGSTNNKDSILNRAYQYDPIGNRITATEGLSNITKNYASNELNQYTEINKSVSSASSVVKNNPTYDLDGNMTTDGVGKTYHWDGENRLIQVTLSNNEIVCYTYDFKSRRIKRNHITPTVTERTTYLYDDWNVITEGTVLNSSFLNLKSYVWGLDLSNTRRGAGGVGGLLQVTDSIPTENGTNNINSYAYTYDANGNISEFINIVTDVIQNHYKYDVFGNITTTGTSGGENYVTFSTKRLDPLASLFYYGYRYCSSITGRWINRDPIEERGGINLVAFSGNNSLNRIDPHGLSVTHQGKIGSGIMWYLVGGNFDKNGIAGGFASYDVLRRIPPDYDCTQLKDKVCCSVKSGTGIYDISTWYKGVDAGFNDVNPVRIETVRRNGVLITIERHDMYVTQLASRNIDAHELEHTRITERVFNQTVKLAEDAATFRQLNKLSAKTCSDCIIMLMNEIRFSERIVEFDNQYASEQAALDAWDRHDNNGYMSWADTKKNKEYSVDQYITY